MTLLFGLLLAGCALGALSLLLSLRDYEEHE